MLAEVNPRRQVIILFVRTWRSFLSHKSADKCITISRHFLTSSSVNGGKYFCTNVTWKTQNKPKWSKTLQLSAKVGSFMFNAVINIKICTSLIC